MVEWSWRIESPRGIVFGSWSSDRRIDNGIARLKSLRLDAIALVGRLPELLVNFSSDRWLSTFMTAEGQPEWTIFLPDHSWLTVERGTVVHDTRNRRHGR
jgi:hypothetical protein